MIGVEPARSRVLVIEDSKVDQRVYRRTLHAFDLEFADSGETGLERIAAGGFDVVVLDFHLPRLNGDEVLARIRGGPDPELPVVIVTGGGSEDVAVDLLRAGASDYVKKDELHTPRVATAVRGALERRRLDLARRAAEGELTRRNADLEDALRKLQEAQAHLIQSEKMASLGQLVAGVAHEINNPLAYVANNLAVLGRDVHLVARVAEESRRHLGDPPPPAVAALEADCDLGYTLGNLDRLLASTRNGLKRVGEIVAGLRDFSRLDEEGSQWVDPNEPARNVVEMIRFHARSRGIELVVDLDALPQATCNPGQINQVLLNLVMNAIQAVGEGATIAVRTRLEPGGDRFRYEVSDDGPGIPEAVVGRIFDPFFTTKGQGVGTGLGLWISYNIAREHGGRIEVDTAEGRGTTFRVILPFRPPGSA